MIGDAHRLAGALRDLALLIPDRDRDVIGIDLETTGLNPDEHELLEVGVARLSTDDRVTVHEGVYRPRGPVSDEILELTGITRAEIEAGRTWDQAEATVYAAGFARCDFLGFNVKHFDLRFFQAQCRKVNVEFTYADARIVDASVLWRQVEKRSLSEYVARFAGRPHEGAHRAVADVAGTAEGLVGFLRTFPAVPRTVQSIHDLCFPRDPSWADAEGKLAWVAGVLCVNFGTQRRGQSVQKLAADTTPRGGRSFLEWVLRSDFPDDTKTILRDLLYGGRLPLAPSASPAPVPADDTPF